MTKQMIEKRTFCSDFGIQPLVCHLSCCCQLCAHVLLLNYERAVVFEFGVRSKIERNEIPFLRYLTFSVRYEDTFSAASN